MFNDDDENSRLVLTLIGSLLLTCWTCLLYKVVTGEWMPLI